jgi:hypothetical protein
MAAAHHRITHVLLTLVLLALLALIAMVATGVRGGPLDPTGSPAPTMKTLDDIPGSWSRKLPANNGAPGPNPPAGCNSTRFTCVLDDLAVRDNETGLVWMRNSLAFTATDWVSARTICYSTATDGRMGWRLPTIDELTSLVDTEAAALPTGHPFENAQYTEQYWSLTSISANARTFRMDGISGNQPKASFFRVWCVRGGHTAETTG